MFERGINARRTNGRGTNGRGTNATGTNLRGTNATGKMPVSNVKRFIWRQITGTFLREEIARLMYTIKTLQKRHGHMLEGHMLEVGLLKVMSNEASSMDNS